MQGYGEPRYDTLLEVLAPSVAARRDLLHHYFEPASDEERSRGVKVPTTAHHAIAELVRDGRVRLILTTNFDRLLEDALTEAGVPPQVIARPDAIAGMAPPQHARATVIKLHGDYLDVESIRNTPAELSAYDPAMRDLLARVLDEYGLIVLGWSGEWDTALVSAIQDCPARRYPTYWAAYHGHISPGARTLLSGRARHLISIDGADSFCAGLRDNVNALARMADPPPTRAVAIAKLKQNLGAGRRIDVFDQINVATTQALDRIAARQYPVQIGSATNEQAAGELESQLSGYDIDTEVLIALSATVTFHGGPDSDDLVLRAARRTAQPPRVFGSHQPVIADARGYPALRLVTAVGVAAVAAHRERLLIPLLVGTSSSTLDISGEASLAECLLPQRVIHDEAALMPQYQPTSRPVWPASHYLKGSCRATLADLTDDTEYAAAFDRYEFLRAMIEIHHTQGRTAALGEFAGRWGAVAPDVAEIDEQWPLVAAGGFSGDPEQARQAHASVLQEITRRGLFGR
jgi:SIR2-like domain